MQRTLYRDSSQKVIGGVASGIAEYLNTDISLIRILFLVFGIWHRFFGAGAIIIYILLWIILPDKAKLNLSDINGSTATLHPENKEFETNYIVDDGSNLGQKASGNSNSVNPTNKTDRSRLAGIILLVVGGLFLIEQNTNWVSALDFEDFDFSIFDKFWPLALIILGIWVLVGRKTKSKAA